MYKKHAQCYIYIALADKLKKSLLTQCFRMNTLLSIGRTHALTLNSVKKNGASQKLELI